MLMLMLKRSEVLFKSVENRILDWIDLTWNQVGPYLFHHSKGHQL